MKFLKLKVKKVKIQQLLEWILYSGEEKWKEHKFKWEGGQKNTISWHSNFGKTFISKLQLNYLNKYFYNVRYIFWWVRKNKCSMALNSPAYSLPEQFSELAMGTPINKKTIPGLMRWFSGERSWLCKSGGLSPDSGVHTKLEGGNFPQSNPLTSTCLRWQGQIRPSEHTNNNTFNP